MDRLFLDGAGERRRFLDRLVFCFDPAHAARVSAYEQTLRERMRLLRDGPADAAWLAALEEQARSEEHTSELQSLMRISYAVFCLKKNNKLISTTQPVCSMNNKNFILYYL